MKKYTFASAVFTMFLLGCEDDIPLVEQYSDYAFASLDTDGGTWNTTLLESPTDIFISAPVDVNSDAFKAQLASLKSITSSLTSKQRKAVEYWTNNPILRWNEIALELAAKYNLIPGPNPDGSYTLPNPENPGATPNFPFAHPPYTARMLAYLSVAQYDGLITVWHYKYTFNRPAPYMVDADVNTRYVRNDLPSYPSDGAVIAVAARDILSVMFPLEKDYLAERANEHLQSLQWAGINVESDISAGQIIGTEVAKLALDRARTDGMGKAQTPKPVSDSIKAAAFERYGWQWTNQETPQRPVGLTPLYGKVRMWNVPNVELVRPPVPPAPGSAEFERDAEELRQFAKNVTPEQRKIANWWSDGLSTYTPPGHWNKLAKRFLLEYKVNPLRSARTFAYLNMAIMDAGISCWDAKYHYHYPRPIETLSGFKTYIGTPNFPSYTSGHSTFSAAAAEVLAYVFPDEAVYCRAWAREAAESRIYGGIHYRFDAEEGLTQGISVASYTIEIAKSDGADN